MTDGQRAKALEHASACAEAAVAIAAALEQGNEPELSDARLLEAAGCYIRRALKVPAAPAD